MRRGPMRHLAHRENVDRWLVSYADYMTLMFALFVVLYAMTIVNEGRYPQLLNTLEMATEQLNHRAIVSDLLGEEVTRQRDIFEEPGSQTMISPEIANMAHPEPDKSLQQEPVEEVSNVNRVGEVTSERLGTPLKQVAEQLHGLLSDSISSRVVAVERDEDWVLIEMDSQQVFPSGSASILNQAKTDLNRVTGVLAKIDNYVRIRGYTDDQPIQNEIYDSNWELSVARAVRVLRYIENRGIVSARLAVEGYGQYSPFEPNVTEENRQANRKVVIALSKYGWQAPKSVLQQTKLIESTKENQPKADSDIILTIPLDGGGVRYTTRQD